MEKNVMEWLERGIIDTIFEKMDNLFNAGKFDEANEILKHVDIPGSSTTILIAWMSVAHWPYRAGDAHKLPYLNEFNARCATEIRLREPGRADSLLKGFAV